MYNAHSNLVIVVNSVALSFDGGSCKVLFCKTLYSNFAASLHPGVHL